MLTADSLIVLAGMSCAAVFLLVAVLARLERTVHRMCDAIC